MSSPTPEAALLALLRVTPVQPPEIARLLDGMTHAARVAAVRALGRPEQRALYEAVSGWKPLRLVDLVPPHVADLAPVRHHGKNTLPAFTLFEKRFTRPRGQDAEKPDELWGYNYQPTPVVGSLTGPGYYLAIQDRARAEVLIDYTRVPAANAGSLPAGWPAVRRNERGLGRFVYGHMIDTLRGVSEHVTIGSAARHGRDMGSWFVLCREDPPGS
jgi:hypothetical protein